MTARSLARPLAALGLPLLAALMLGGMGSLPPLGGSDPAAAPRPADAPFDCVLATEPAGDLVRFAGRLTAAEAVSGRYGLSLRGPGTTLEQGGDFVAAAGETVALGQATLSTAPDEARLTVTVGGRQVPCRREG